MNVFFISLVLVFAVRGEARASLKRKACGGVFTSSTGTFKTPNFPNDYPSDTDCTWTIQGAPGTQTIELNFINFKVEWGGTCEWDYVLIKDKDDKIIGSKMCGMKYSFPIKVPGDKAVVIFHSDDYGNENGFKVNFKTIAAPPKALPGSCNFDQDLCPTISNVDNKIDNFDWTVHSGPTPTGYLLTGPKADHTSGQGKYVYIESTGRSKGDKAQLQTQVMSGNRCLKFFYHMFGTIGMGDLKVYVVTNGNKKLVKSINGNQGNEWKAEEIQITETTPYKIVFEGIVGRYDDSDIALDDILFSDTKCSLVKECEAILTASVGAFESPGFPGDYKDNLRCKWTIRPAKKDTSLIIIKFLSFDVENRRPSGCNDDYVKITDSKGQVIRKACGIESFGVKVFDKEAIVHFDTNQYFVEKGFQAVYEAKTSSPLDCDFDHGMCQMGWGHDASGDFQWSIRSRGTPSFFTGPESDLYRIGKYAYIEASGRQFLDKATLLSPPLGGPKCMTFHYNMNGQRMGSLAISIVSSAGRREVWRTAGHHGRYWLKDSVSLDAGQAYKVSFEGAVGNGFTSDIAIDEISFTDGACPKTLDCNHILTDTSGTIQSPNYPAPYPSGKECIWTIIPPPRYHGVKITFTDVDMQDSATCSKDYVIVRDNSGPIGTQIGEKICGKPKTPKVVTVDWQQAKVQFFSDSTVQGKGFQATYQAYQLVPACGGELSGNSGTIQSPNYPNDSPERMICNWEITTSTKVKQIIITFDNNFSIDDGSSCNSDYVVVYDQHRREEIKRVCGKYHPGWAITVNGNAATVQFEASYIKGKERRFKATYTTVM